MILTFPVWAEGSPTLLINETSLTASGLTPGGTAVWFGMIRTGNGAYLKSDVALRVTEIDAVGETELSLSAGVPVRSVWMVADVVTGTWVWAQPEESLAREEAIPASAVVVAADGKVHHLLIQHHWLWVLVLRPGVGAWSLLSGDGQQGDVDGITDGWLGMDLAAFEPQLASEPPPSELQTGDVLAWIEPRQLVFAATTVSLAGGQP